MTIHNRVQVPVLLQEQSLSDRLKDWRGILSGLFNGLGKNKPISMTEIVTFNFPPGENEKEHCAVLYKGWDKTDTPLVRIHSKCFTGDVLGSSLCDCGPQLDEAKNRFTKEGGILIYLDQEGRGIGLKGKMETYVLQQKFGFDTFTANRALGHRNDERSYAVAAQMLTDLGVKQIRLLSNNEDKAQQLIGNGIRITETIPTGFYPNPNNQRYLDTKRKSGHLFPEAK